MNGSGVVMNDLERVDRVFYTSEQPAGALAAAAWLSARGLRGPHATSWDVAIALDVVDQPASPTVTDPDASRFHIAVAATEWGFLFCHHRLVSWIRVTDVPFVNDRDDYALLAHVPPLRDLGTLLLALEQRHQIAFRREHASIRTNLPDAERPIRTWLAATV